MNFHNITTEDMNNGDGLRTVLWVAGCSHHCNGCHNPQTWDPLGGVPFDDDAFNELIMKLGKDYISGITFSGGDPLYCDNRKSIGNLIKTIKDKFGDTKDIWLYTGFDWEEIYSLPFIENVDILIDGKFELENRNISLKWKGSPNQRIIDVKATLNSDNPIMPILYCMDESYDKEVTEQLFNAKASSCCND